MDMNYFKIVSKKIKLEKPQGWTKLAALPAYTILSQPIVINGHEMISICNFSYQNMPKQLIKFNIISNKWQQYLSYTHEMLQAAYYQPAAMCIDSKMQKLYILEYDTLFQIESNSKKIS